MKLIVPIAVAAGLAAAAACIALLPRSPHHDVRVIERVAARAEKARQLAPETRRALGAVAGSVDCDARRCAEPLRTRSQQARARLESALRGPDETSAIQR
jgi:hypothetical protein